jgi:hypothetical protein
VSVAQASERLRAFSRKALYQAARGAFFRALQVGRAHALGRLRGTHVGQTVQRRGNVLLQLGLKKRWKPAAASPGAIRAAITRRAETLAGLQASTIPLVVRRAEMSSGHAGLGLRSGLETMGFAALIETGGRTKGHSIKRIRLGGYSRRRATRQKQVNALPPMRFQVGGKWISARVVTHPGSKIPATPFLEDGARAAVAALPEFFEQEVSTAMKAAGL